MWRRTFLYLRVPSVLVMWFLFLLLVFNTVYALGFGPAWHVEKPCPSLPRLFTMVTICLGVPGNSILAVYKCLYSSIRIVTSFFFGGCVVAGMNNWLDIIQARLRDPGTGKSIRRGVYATVFIAYMVYMVVFGVFYYPKAYQICPLVICYVLDGLLGVSACTASVLFFRDYFDWIWNPATFIIWAGTYAAYTLQTPFILLGIYIVLAIDPSNDPSAAMVSTYELDAVKCWPYTILASLIAVVSSFGFEFLMRSLPHFDTVF